MKLHLDGNDIFYMTDKEKIYAVQLPQAEEEEEYRDENGILDLAPRPNGSLEFSRLG